MYFHNNSKKKFGGGAYFFPLGIVQMVKVVVKLNTRKE